MVKKKDIWLMPTNTDNLRMIIAQGLISSPDGFKKYYSDALEIFSGYIPLFKNRIQPDILNSVVSETDGLTQCILEFDITKIEGTVKVIDGNELVDIDLGEVEKGGIEILLILAPLSLSSISKVIFESDDDIKTFKEDAELYNNVVFNNLKFSSTKAGQKLFDEKAEMTDQPLEHLKNIEVQVVKYIDYKKVYAFGGLLANLFYFAKNGKLSNDIFSSFSARENIIGKYDFLNIINYFDKVDSSLNDNLYNSIVDIAIRGKNFKEDVIELLESDAKTVHIANKLKAFDSISDKPVSQEFSEAKTLFGKTLIMLFLREDSESLIEYNLDIFSEEDYLTFAMMFGIRDKFIKTPKFLREFKDLQNFISTKMANYAHESINSQIKFKEPKQPLTIVDMLKNNRFKEYFSKELKIENCFQTVVSKSDYRVVKGKPIFEGIVMPKFEILEERYFKFMSTQIPTEHNKYLDKYNKVK